MSDHSAIEWTDSTWNPLVGCSRVSQGCVNCYAERHAYRFARMPGTVYEGTAKLANGKPTFTGRINLNERALGDPWRWSRGRRIFVNSMSDLFHENVPFEFIAAVFFIMSVTTRHTYQVLTKRPQRMLDFFAWVDAYEEKVFNDDRIGDVAAANPAIKALGWTPWREGERHGGYDNCGPGWPYENVWLGVSVEDQSAADERIPLLLRAPAAVRFLSCEPLLGHVDVSEFLRGREEAGIRGNCVAWTPPVDWVIAGGESGPRARPSHPDWYRDLRDQCRIAGVPFLFKQWGEFAPSTIPAAEFFKPVSGRDGEMIARSDGSFSTIPESDMCCVMRRVGKKAEGRTLDGAMHTEFPRAA